jgi:hypothetical protein
MEKPLELADLDLPMLDLTKPLHVQVHKVLSTGCYTMSCSITEVNGLHLEHWEIYYRPKGWFNKARLLQIPVGLGKEFISSWTSKDAAQTALKNYLLTKFKYSASMLNGERELNLQ